MRVDGQMNPAALWFKNVEKDPSAVVDVLTDKAAAGKSASAKAAAPNTSFPTQMLAKLDSASILSLQKIEFEVDDNGGRIAMKPTDEFMAYMEKTPEERLRANILKSIGVTEEELESLPPEQRQAVEDKIKELIKERIRPAANLGLPSGDVLNRRPGWVDTVTAGLATPGASAASLGNGLPPKVLAAAGHKPREN